MLESETYDFLNDRSFMLQNIYNLSGAIVPPLLMYLLYCLYYTMFSMIYTINSIEIIHFYNFRIMSLSPYLSKT